MAVLPKACRNLCASGAAAALRERNSGAGQEISESSPMPTGSECRFGIGASRAACQNSCASGAVAALRERNSSAGPEISESDPGPTGSECRFGIGASRAVPIAG
ncbi:hypothetical protein Taro_056630 [Colocasia esculenta]|uniref:Uncharacterized protein n=1 Tax=Colocasia esculenta TaxID=4460 RepID=A0A843XUE7_COLES|nr:hypothetical protein [Colocasia esculenta]